MKTYKPNGNENFTIEMQTSETDDLPGVPGFHDYSAQALDYTQVIPAGSTVRADYFWGYKRGDSYGHSEVFDLCLKVDRDMPLSSVSVALQRVYFSAMLSVKCDPREAYGIEAIELQENGDYKLFFGT